MMLFKRLRNLINNHYKTFGKMPKKIHLSYLLANRLEDQMRGLYAVIWADIKYHAPLFSGIPCIAMNFKNKRKIVLVKEK